MRPRASQVARIRFVETEEDVETYRPVPDAIKTAIGDRQAELAKLEEELSADATEARRRLEEEDVETVHEDDDLSVSVHWPDTPHLVRG